MSSPLITPSPTLLTTHPRPRLLRQVAGATIAGVAVLGAAAAWQGARLLHDKPGEQSLARLVPKEALSAFSLDLKPSSWEQVQVMRKINDALHREQLPDEVMRSLDPSLAHIPVLRDLKPYLSGSGAFAAWGGEGKVALPTLAAEPDWSHYRIGGFWSVSSPREVESILKKHAVSSTTTNGVTVCQLSLSQENDAPQKVWATLLGSYLVVGSSQETIADVAAVWQGKHPSLTSDANYTAIRATLPADANLIAYVSPQGMQLMQKQSATLSSDSSWQQWRTVQGAALSATIRQNGIRLDSSTQTDDARYNALRAAPPLASRLTGQVPDGAMAFAAFSQPRALFDTAEAFLRDAPASTRKDWDKSKADFEKESGLSVTKDVLPGFAGDSAVALYPGEGQQPIRWVGLLSDARQAQPAQLLEKVQHAIQKDEPAARFVSTAQGGATYWTMPRTAADKTSVGRDMGKATLASDHGDVSLYAQVGQSALTASSRSLLETAVNTYESPRPAQFPNIPKDAQMLVVIRPTRVIDAIEHVSPEAFKEAKITAQEARDLSGGQDLVISGSYGPKYLTSTAFLPIQYDKTVSLVARIARTERAKAGQH